MLTCRTLTKITQGQWCPGIPPPLEGIIRPVRRIVLDSSLAGPGDAYFHLPGYPQADRGCWPDEAYAAGAGVVITAEARIEPWAGAARILVTNPEVALQRLARWYKRRSSALSVMICGRHAALLSAVLANCHAPSNVHCPSTLTELIEVITAAKNRRGLSVVAWDALRADEVNLALCLSRPDLVVWCNPWCQSPVVKKLATSLRKCTQASIYPLDESNCAIAYYQRLDGKRSTHTLQLRPVGDQRRTKEEIVLAVPDEVTQVQIIPPIDIVDWAALWSASLLLGIPLELFLDERRRLLRDTSQLVGSLPSPALTFTTAVPPCISDMQESDAPVPPGWKRFSA